MQVADDYEAMSDSSALLQSPAAIATQLDETGFVFLRDVLDRELVNRTGSEIQDRLFEKDLVESRDGRPIWTGNEIAADFDDTDLYLAPSLEGLLESAALRQIAAILLGEAAFIHRSPSVRYAVPRDFAHQTPAHQDHFFIRESDRFLTIWIPLIDISRDVGGLAVARGSHKHGLFPHESIEGVFSAVFRKKSIFGIPQSKIPKPWQTIDYAPGDVLLFNSRMIHWALPNLSETLRLSIDVRCQPESAPRIWQMVHTIPEQRAYRSRALEIARSEGIGDIAFETVLLELMRRGADLSKETVLEAATRIRTLEEA